MLHDALKSYLDGVEQAVLRYTHAYVERYVEEILTPERVNLKIRLRTARGHLVEIHEAVVMADDELVHLDYRYHCQDDQNRLRFAMTVLRISLVCRLSPTISIYREIGSLPAIGPTSRKSYKRLFRRKTKGTHGIPHRRHVH